MPRQPKKPGDTTACAASALASMPDVMRLVLLLRVYDGWKSWEVSRAAGYDIKIVRSLEERGLRAVEKALGAPMERAALRACVYDAFELMIDGYGPDQAAVERVRAYLMRKIS